MRGGSFLCVAGCALSLVATPDQRVVANRNLRAAGVIHERHLEVALEVRNARWFPGAADGPSLPVQAFGEAGHAPEIPGPLIRAPLGTTITVSIHNTTDSTLRITGLANRSPGDSASIVVPPGRTRTTTFTADRVGTFYYWGTTTSATIDTREWLDSQLSGAFVVDPPGAPPQDRIFVLGIWSRTDNAAPGGDIMTINGRGWPWTEPITTVAGDSMSWRWINASGSSHPMHLHGVFFRVKARGDAWTDTTYAPGRQPLAVTELMLPGGTMTMKWAAARPGNWLFHCHFAFHASAYDTVDPPDATAKAHGVHDPVHGMGALVLGITAQPRPGTAPPSASASTRPLRLVVQAAPNRFGVEPGFGYVLEQGNNEPAPDSIAIPGAAIILTRDEAVRITVVNHLAEPTAVHWHGIELQSYPDGVPGWSGVAPRLFRAIAPGDSFAAEFTPPRSGTFIYHTHFNETRQLGLGLYGPLLVLDPGTRYDPGTDHVVIVGLDGSSLADSADTAHALINGRREPAPLVLRAGVRHRLRLINIDPNQRITFALMRDSVQLDWRPVAKDGADLPPALSGLRPARLMTGPGETADFEIEPREPGNWRLVVSAPFITKPWSADLPITVQ